MNITSRRNLSVGLEAILNSLDTSKEPSSDPMQRELKHVNVFQLVPGTYQPRREFDPVSLQELADSIAAQGILQPIIVRDSTKNAYEIIAGERRWRAAQMAGLQQVPIIVCNISNQNALAFGLIENIQRQNLNPIEEAFALRRLIDEFKITHDKVAQSVGRSRAVVSNTLRLLNLCKPVQDLLIAKKLDVGHARLLLVFSSEEQEEFSKTIIQKKLTVRAAEKFIKAIKSGKHAYESDQSHLLCEEWGKVLTKKLEAEVSVKLNRVGIGKVIIEINSIDQIESFIKSI